MILAIEQIPQDHHLIPLLSISQQFADRQAQEFPHQIQQGAFHRCLRMYHKLQVAQVQLLKPLPVIAPGHISVISDAADNALVLSNCPAHHQGDVAFKYLCDIIPAVHLSHSRIAGVIRYDHDIPGKERGMGPA